MELMGKNTAESTYGIFTFPLHFFDAYEVSTSSAKQGDSVFRCRVPAKLLVGIFKSRGPSPGRGIEKCMLRIEQTSEPVHVGGANERGQSTTGSASQRTDNNSGECRLVIQMTYQEGICRTHRLFYEECETFHSIHKKENCRNRLRISSKIASDWISHFSRGQEEVSLHLSRTEVRIRSWAEGLYAGLGRTQAEAAVAENTRVLQTEITVDPQDFESYHITDSHHPTEVTFSLRDFKPILQYADAMSMPLCIYCDKGGDPVMFSVGQGIAAEHNVLNLGSQNSVVPVAEFVMATIPDYTYTPQSTGSERVGSEDVYSISRQVSEVESFTPHKNRQLPPLGAARDMARLSIDDISSMRSPSSAGSFSRRGTTQELRRREQEESMYAGGMNSRMVQTPSPYHSGHELWVGVDLQHVESGRSDSLLHTPTSTSSVGKRAATANADIHAASNSNGTPQSADKASNPASQPIQQSPAHNNSQQASTTTRSYRLLDMPRPPAPLGVTDAVIQDQNTSLEAQPEEEGDVEVASDGRIQTKLPFQAKPRDFSDNSSDEELGATPPPPSKKYKSIF